MSHYKKSGIGPNIGWVTILGLSGIAVASQLITIKSVSAQVLPPDVPQALQPLSSATVPMPENLDLYIKDRTAAIKLGKALFWDMQAGSEKTACASCHYNAGADSRDVNQLSNGPDAAFDNGHTVNFQLKKDTHFPFTKFTDSQNVSSPKTRSSNDIVGSQGVFTADFAGLSVGVLGVGATGIGSVGVVDNQIIRPNAIFSKNQITTRQVTGRNAPTTINAIFNHRNFWDGRAHNEFNGVNPYGDSDTDAVVYEYEAVSGITHAVRVSIVNASLASQAVGPLNSTVEMAAKGRNFPDVARKLRSLLPLGLQKVSTTDSVLGTLARPLKGLNTTYDALIEAAIVDKWWSGTDKYTVEDGRVKQSATGMYSHKEANFSLIFGLAVLMYESTLVADQTPYDKYLEGNTTAISASAIRGITALQTQGCVNCHTGVTLTSAASPVLQIDAELQGLKIFTEVMVMQDGLPSAYDIGYYNIGVRPTAEDIGIGAIDPFNNPLSFSAGVQSGFIEDLNRPVGQEITADTRLGVMGAFKTPGLRNVALTGPYMHTGGYADLFQTINNYHRGGDFGRENMPNTSPDVALAGGMTIFQKRDLVQLMIEMTDPRVENQSAPFDHPQIVIPIGHTVKANTPGTLINSGNGTAQSNFLTIPATGRNGGLKLKRFLGFTETRNLF